MKSSTYSVNYKIGEIPKVLYTNICCISFIYRKSDMLIYLLWVSYGNSQTTQAIARNMGITPQIDDNALLLKTNTCITY